MASPHAPEPVMLLVAAFSRHLDALAWTRENLTGLYGALAGISEPLVFDQTQYYAATMGPDLRKQFVAFAGLRAPDELPAIKLHTNSLEEELAAARTYPEPRPLNLDPGFLSLGKFVLATTKDQAHRIYLGQGIFAEVTLRFHAHRFEPWPWTYADYRQPAVLDFLGQMRQTYRTLLAALRAEQT
jgi:hypothetical protein